jgi:hypothetical protein
MLEVGVEWSEVFRVLKYNAVSCSLVDACREYNVSWHRGKRYLNFRNTDIHSVSYRYFFGETGVT